MRFVRDTPIRGALIEFADGPPIVVAGTDNLEFELVCEGGLIRIRNDGEALEVRKRAARSGFDTIEVQPVPGWSGTVRKIRDLVQAIRSGVPAVSNLRIAMLSTEIGFGLYESHLRGGARGASPDSQPHPRRIELVTAAGRELRRDAALSTAGQRARILPADDADAYP